MITTLLIAANLLVFVYLAARDPQSLSGRLTIGQAELGLTDGAVGDGFGVRFADGSVYSTGGGQWYRLVTSGFTHFGIIHIGFNMYLLYMLGQMLEPPLGRVKFGLVYLAGLLGGSAGVLIWGGNAVSAGASGAVFGLMAFAFVGYYLNGTNPMNTSIGTLLMLNLVLTFVFPRISIGGHLGGVVAGAACAFVVMAPRHRGYPLWTTYAMPVLVSLASIAVAVAAVR